MAVPTTTVKSKTKEATPKQEVKSILAKIVLVNPFTQVRASPGVVSDHIIADSWWESQVKAGLAKWQ